MEKRGLNILFLTIGRLEDVKQHSLYTDLLRCLRDSGHRVCTVSPYEKHRGLETTLIREDGVEMLHVRTGNLKGQISLLEKGIATLTLERSFIRAIRKYFPDVRFDLVIYSTPPITFCRVVQFIRKRDGAASYLLLKDIFPQNAVDIGILSVSGAKAPIYSYFRRTERRLYRISDHIGCMSAANVRYLLEHNPSLDPEKVEVCPNAIEVMDRCVDPARRAAIREAYGLPPDKTIFVYGGNLGRPQGIPFLMDCLKAQKREDTFFLIVGDGVEYERLRAFLEREQLPNVRLLNKLPKEDYDAMVGACDVGLLFLDHRFTIPNFPSRMLAYMQAKLPVLAATDPNTDVGKTITDGGFGWWCESDSVEAFTSCLEQAMAAELPAMGERAFSYLRRHYSVEDACRTLTSHFIR